MKIEGIIFDWAGTTVDYGWCAGTGICGGISCVWHGGYDGGNEKADGDAEA